MDDEARKEEAKTQLNPVAGWAWAACAVYRPTGGAVSTKNSWAGFKQVNDEYGHNVSNLLLLAASKRMLTPVSSDDTVARQAGDKYVVIAPDSYAGQIFLEPASWRFMKIASSKSRPVANERQFWVVCRP